MRISKSSAKDRERETCTVPTGREKFGRERRLSLEYVAGG